MAYGLSYAPGTTVVIPRATLIDVRIAGSSIVCRFDGLQVKRCVARHYRRWSCVSAHTFRANGAQREGPH